VAAVRSAVEGRRLMASRSRRVAAVRAVVGRSVAAVRGEGSRLVTGGVARLEPDAGVRAALISGRVRPGAAGSERVMDGAVRLTVGARGVAADGAAGSERVMDGAVRLPVSGARVTAVRVWGDGAALGVLAGRGCMTTGRGAAWRVTAGAEGARVTEGCGGLTRDGAD